MNIYQKYIYKIRKNYRIKRVMKGELVRVEYMVEEKIEHFKNQIFEGMCVARKNNNISSTFTLKKIKVLGADIFKKFVIFSPLIKKITILKKIT